jgi:uncharacterized membrane protein
MPATAQSQLNGRSMIDFVYIFAAVLFTVYGQLVVKWQVLKAGTLPTMTRDKIFFLLSLVFNPWILSGLAAAFLAMLCWLVAMTKFELSYAYPFMSLAFVLVLFLSALFFHETINVPKVLGVLLVIVGIIVASRG